MPTLSPHAKTLFQPLSAEARRRTVIRSLATVLVSSAASLAIASLYFLIFGVAAGFGEYAISIVIPALVATPTCLWLFARIEQINQAYANLDTLASTDWLTQCLNRRAFTAAVDDPNRGNGLQALIVIDVDHFKSINDSYGHECGDDVLRRVADAIHSATRVSDVVGRIGGEEFGVLIALDSPGEAVVRAERIRAAVESIMFRPAALPHRISVSVGIAISTGPLAFADLFRTADRCLYKSKRNGRNRVSAAFAKAA